MSWLTILQLLISLVPSILALFGGGTLSLQTIIADIQAWIQKIIGNKGKLDQHDVNIINKVLWENDNGHQLALLPDGNCQAVHECGAIHPFDPLAIVTFLQWLLPLIPQLLQGVPLFLAIFGTPTPTPPPLKP
jgi:hypothetical protein